VIRPGTLIRRGRSSGLSRSPGSSLKINDKKSPAQGGAF
jgi:hypothetical protein